MTSFTWSGDEELIYTSFPSSAQANDRDCGVYRQSVTAGTDARVQVATLQRYRGHSGEWLGENAVGALDVWSPKGRYLIYADGPFQGGNVCVLDTRRGGSNAVLQVESPSGRRNVAGVLGKLSEAVSWNMDETEVVIVIHSAYEPRFFRLRMETGKASDLSVQFKAIGQLDAWQSLNPLWTADGKYVTCIISESLVLIHPDPWQVVTLPLDSQRPHHGGFVAHAPCAITSSTLQTQI